MDVTSFLSTQLQIVTIIALYSYLFIGRNILFRIFTDLIVGYAVANALAFCVNNVMVLGINAIPDSPVVIIPVILGLMLYLVFWPKYSWLTAFPVAIAFGVSMGLMFGRGATGWLTYMLEAMKITDIHSLIALVITISILFVFIFHKPITATEGKITDFLGNWGRFIMMICFGGALGLMVITNIDKHFLAAQIVVNWIKSGFGLG